MGIDTKILDSLHKYKDGYISGEELASKLKVSRTAVWNHIDYFRKHGYDIEAHPRLGYKLINIPDRLFPDEIQRDLHTKIIGKKVWVYEKTTSTNDIAWDLAIKNEHEGGVVFAESQTKGRGRLGRIWNSPKRKGLWFSVILRPDLQPIYAPMITIASSIAVAKSIIKYTGLSVWIKWPNDIYMDNKKLGGILTEMNTELDSIKFVVLGIGINVNSTINDFSDDLKNKVVSLQCSPSSCAQGLGSRLELAKEILVGLDHYYKMLNQKKWVDIITEWKDLSLVLGRRIKLKQGNKRYEGQVVGLDEQGALMLRQDGGFIHHITSGEILCF